MSAFRLARLLALREEQERAEKIRWAQAQRAAAEAAATRDAGRARIQAAYREVAESRGESAEARSGTAFRMTLAAYRSIDHLHARAAADDETLAETRRAALDARAPYDQRRQDVEALRRLEERFRQTKKRKRRRRDNREREAFINGRFAGAETQAAPSDTQSTPTSPATEPDQ